jgi:hypothetical protein
MENVIYYWLYWLIAAILSIFQGYRGYVAQKQMCELQENNFLIEKKTIEVDLDAKDKLAEKQYVHLNENLKDELIKAQDGKFVIYAKTKRQIIWLRAIPYCFFYFITTLLGFVALFFAYYILTNACNLNDISGGTAALIIFSVLFGLLGITGQLPNLLEQGKFPR